MLVSAAVPAAMTKDVWWVYLLGVLISSGVLTGAFAAVSRFLASLRRRRGVKELGRTFAAQAELNSALNDVRAVMGACRASILKSTNGGGIPSPGKQLYTSVVYESYSNDGDSTRDLWQNMPVDAPYSQLLSDLYEKKAVNMRTDLMHPGDLKSLYRSTGVEMATVRKIGCSDRAMYYLSLNYKRARELADGEMITLRAAVAHMARLFEQSKEIYEYDFGAPKD